MSSNLLSSSFKSTVRHCRRDPLWVCLVLGLLGLGMGAGLASLQITDVLFWEPLPFPDPDRLVYVSGWQEEQQRYTTFSFPHYVELRSLADSPAELAAYMSIPIVLSLDRPESLRGELVSTNYFDLLRVRPQLGEWPGTRSPLLREIAISEPLWRRLFNANPDVIGQSVQVNRQDFRIVAVAPSGFRGLDSRLHPQFWIPSAQWPILFPSAAELLESEDVNPFQLIGRLRGSATGQSAEAALAPLYDRLQAALPEAKRSRLRVFSGQFARFWPGDRETMGRIAGVLLVMTFGMLVASALNAGNLMRVHLARRRMEFALRRSLGATAARVASQLVLEKLLLVAGGCLLSVPVGWSFIELISTYRLPAPVASGFGNGYRLALFLSGTAIVTLLLAVVNPLRQVLGPSWIGDLKSGRRGGSSIPQRAGFFNISAQVAVGALLAMGAGLLFLSLDNALNVPLGFRHQGIQVATLGYYLVGFPEEQANSANELLKGILEGEPGIERVEFAGQVPFSQVQRLRDVQAEREDRTWRLQESFVSDGLLELLEIPILQGRSFDARDRDGAPPVALVDAVAARTLWPAGNALGARFRLSSEEDWRTVVGIAGEIRQSSLRQPSRPVVYVPLEQSPLTEVSIFLRTSSPSVPVAEALGSALRQLSPEPPVYSLQPLTEHVERGFSQVRLLAWLGAASAGSILFLVLAGVYAMIRQVAAQRRFEAGLRMALGATPQQITRFFSRQILAGSLLGVAAGSGLALLLQSSLAGFLFEVDHLPPLVWLVISGGVLTACWIAALLPARHASTLDIAAVLREE